MVKHSTSDQRGLSLIEIIVVLAIIAVIGGGSLISLSLITGQNIKSCYKELEGYMEETRIRAMSRDGSPSMEISIGADGAVYVTQTDTAVTTKIGKKGLTVKYITPSDTYTVDETNHLVIGFEHSTGAFKKVDIPSSTDKEYCNAIVLSDGQREYTMKLVPRTGKYYRE